MEYQHREQLREVMEYVKIDPFVICLECGRFLYIDSCTYWNVEDSHIRCQFCKALIAVTTEEGQIKKMRLIRDPNILNIFLSDVNDTGPFNVFLYCFCIQGLQTAR